MSLAVTKEGVAMGNEDEDSSSSSSSSFSTTETTSKPDPKNNPTSTKAGGRDGGAASKPKLGQKETRDVFLLRLLVFTVLFSAAAAVSVVVFLITKDSNVHEFKSQYDGNAKQLTDAFHVIVKEKLSAISGLAVAMVVHTEDTNSSWPFVTLRRFQERAATIHSLSKALFLGYAPYVSDVDRESWERYVIESASWLTEGRSYQQKVFPTDFSPSDHDGDDDDRLVNSHNTSDPIFYISDEHDEEETIIDPGPGPYLPLWQTSPILHRQYVNQNLFRNPDFAWGSNISWSTSSFVLGSMDTDATPGSVNDTNTETSFYATIMSMAKGALVPYSGEPMSRVYLPVFSSFDNDRYPVATLFAVINWAYYFEDILPPNVQQGIFVVLKNSCDGEYTYQISGGGVKLLGKGDLHEKEFEDMRRTANFDDLVSIADGTQHGLSLNQDECQYSIDVYPSKALYDSYQNNTPTVITISVATIFVFTVIMFLLYDRIVERRQQLILRKATQSAAIVSSMFPENVRERLMQDTCADERVGRKGSMIGGSAMNAPNNRLKSYLRKGSGADNEFDMAPIADLFPHTTVFFADISGFTAWSSTRDPAQVFILLQAVYQAFDTIANKRQVFKVETIGDSYVAVTGLPEPQEKHAVIMSRFAADCMTKMDEVTKQLEVTLGPDTSDLCMRMGMHSGPVTAGVLRGERARFQLFGDTVNTAARMESTGKARKIQISQSTADLLFEAEKGHWVTPREDVVQAKGKGFLKTYWLAPVGRKAESTVSQITDRSDDTPKAAATSAVDSAAAFKRERLVHWIVELLADHIKQILAKRKAVGLQAQSLSTFVFKPMQGKTSLDEVAERIELPKFDAKAAHQVQAYHSIEIDAQVLKQLHQYVSIVAAMYHENPFHNFEHACHVTMAVNKFLKRIVAPDIAVENVDEVASQIHDYTHGINSDPVAHFAIVLSALIHDADHHGVSNAQLIKEDRVMAERYRNKSVAEQNSLDLSWDLFMTEQYIDIRRCIFADEADLMRFRQVLVNVVLATDIFDKELNDLRKARWNKAFNNLNNEHTSNDNNNLKATIVIEHIIQASDVAHTMQHWHIYQKWNKRLFHEMYKAFRQGRMGMDPAQFWYKGEIGFFDNYIIPLAKKLKDCNVFGVSSDECLNYAMKNRDEWEGRGHEIVEQMVNEMIHEYGIEKIGE